MPLWFKDEPNWRMELCTALKIWFAWVMASVVGTVLESLGKGLAATSEERSNGRICRNCGILTELHLNDG
jgi:hypothetical protein